MDSLACSDEVPLAVGDYRYQPGSHWLTATGNAARTLDPSGNTTARSMGGDTLGFTYDDRGRLIAAKRGDTPIATYLYNATGERLAKRLANGTEQRFFYNEASQLIAERGEDARDYVWLGDLPVAVIDTHQGSSTLLAIHADHLGTPRVITDGEGKAVWSWSLHDDPFGESAPVSSSGYVFPLRFAGQYYDQETGLHYNLQRYYDPTVGRYVTSDPVGISTFAYVRSNPKFISEFDVMDSKNTWLGLRLALVIVNIVGLQLIFQEKTNLDLLAGCAGGVVFFAVLRLWLRRIRRTEDGSFTSLYAAFLPMARHPHSYWFTIGLSLLLGAIFGLATHMADRRAVQFFGALVIFGVSILLAVISSARARKE